MGIEWNESILKNNFEKILESQRILSEQFSELLKTQYALVDTVNNILRNIITVKK